MQFTILLCPSSSLVYHETVSELRGYLSCDGAKPNLVKNLANHKYIILIKQVSYFKQIQVHIIGGAQVLRTKTGMPFCLIKFIIN